MADRKWELDQRTTYQIYIGVYHAARLLHASETENDGPFEMAYETNGVEGWDDILIFEQLLNNVYATHYQVKEQTSDFKHTKGQETVSKYFHDAAQILEASDPYQGNISVPPERRRFVLGFPDLSVGLLQNGRRTPLRFSALGKLATKCKGSGSPHLTIANSKGANLDADERLWLEVVHASVEGDWPLTAMVLRHLELRPFGTKPQVRETTEDILSLVWKVPSNAFNALEQVIRASNPSSRLHEDDFLPQLASCERNNPSTRIKFCHDKERYFVRQGQTFADSVALLWRPSNAGHLCVDFAYDPVSSENRALRTAILRLSLHTSGVTVTRSAQWWVASKEGIRGALGVSGDAFYAKEEFFNNNPLPGVSRAPISALDSSAFHEALSREMDTWLWDRVDSEIKSIITRDTDSLKEDLRKSWASLSSQIFPHWSSILKAILKAECEGNSITPELRAGPRLASLIAQTLTVVTALHALGYYSPDPGGLGKIGDTAISGIALNYISDQQGSDGGVIIWRRARELLRSSGLLVLGSAISVADFLEWTHEGLSTSSGFDSPVSLMVLSYEPQFCRAIGGSREVLRAHFAHRMKSISRATEAAFEAELKQLAREETK